MKTQSELETEALRTKVESIYRAAGESGKPRRRQGGEDLTCFDKNQLESHVRFLLSGLKHLSPGFVSLDASRPWLVYWIVHGLSLLGVEYDEGSDSLKASFEASPEMKSALLRAPKKRACVDFLLSCQNPSGGFGGGPQQLSHIATTYAAVAALIIIGGKEALSEVDRDKTRRFLARLQVKEGEYKGAFCVHVGGEVDMRACYLTMAVGRMLKLDSPFIDVTSMVDFIKKCQSYEGGFGGEPGNEAHGGYSYCGFAALVLAGAEDQVDMYQLLDWASNRQQNFEGGFNGRTNKLVDSCYSFWNGALLCVLYECLGKKIGESKGIEGVDEKQGEAFNIGALQDWILLCCQMAEGGLRDKPGKGPDYYHTCYSLCGLSLSIHHAGKYRGPASEQVFKADLLCNIRTDKLNGL